ncbi:tripartite tricarboxylate transporter substrate binding protein [Polynucleobacter sp. IMCC 30228]|uniref:Bug family tripartite tricarboxylate transporter substrate binding protein n=1 Tax=Polynucleobacter sp. IMCC 30228 TaxID=2781011 RepID=UPI001F3D8B41|nr:tripartite tricarboxylate transporter substrate binding protein [Polynucleobacter sp. IMCC 30228]MCE7527402.1 tripartite tricarboxylate transporter substrate binding protein [Polynucleobacter sp. IMCC 30228]
MALVNKSAKALLVGICTCLLSLLANAQSDYPTKPITYVVPYPPGGAADVFARQLAKKLSERLGKPVVIENRPGANGNIGSEYVAKAPADGYMILLGSASTITINPHLYGKQMPYDPMKDLQPVSGTHEMANVLVVNIATPYKSVADVVAAAKAKPGAIAYASAGNGNTMHLAGEQFKMQADIDLLHVPYKGGPPALNDVLGGQVPMMFNNLPAIVMLVNSGKLRALGVGSAKRSPLLPSVPTMDEAGMKGYVSIVWNGIFVRAGTPRPIVERLNREIVAILNEPDTKRSLEEQGFNTMPTTPEQFADLIRADYPRWGTLVKASGAKVD